MFTTFPADEINLIFQTEFTDFQPFLENTCTVSFVFKVVDPVT